MNLGETPFMGDAEVARIRADKIDVERDRGVTIAFGDGHTCAFGNEELRRNCPCASCRDLRASGREVWPAEGAPAEVKILHAELVGSWGISFAWNDGHGTGIFPFDSLRSWCDQREEEGAPPRVVP